MRTIWPKETARKQTIHIDRENEEKKKENGKKGDGKN